MARLWIFLFVYCVASSIFISSCFDGEKWTTYNEIEEYVRQIDVRFESPPGSAPIKKVHIVFMNHLDVGYNGISPEVGFINNILNKYFHIYFPRAVALDKQLTQGSYVETFRYTTQPWLVSLFLECPPNFILAGVKLKCPNSTEVTAFKDAVRRGVITWHAGPMNMQPEMLDESLFTFGLLMSRSLDDQFGIKRAFRVLSQRDVPGMTQSVIPSLLKMGVGGVSVGVNPMTAPPAVPSVFRWKYGDQEVLATWHAGGYPNNPGSSPSNPGGLSIKDCAVVQGHPEALCFAFRTDNSGPPENVQEILGYYEILRKQFPEASLAASAIEDFMGGLQPIRSKLPVVNREIGDTWIMGVSSDPRKTAEYRAAAQVLNNCVKTGACAYSDARVTNASRFLLKMGEHTWGLPSVGDNVNWTNKAFSEASHGSNYMNCSRAWEEQRAFLNLTLEALGNHTVAAAIRREVSQTRPAEPDLSEFTPLDATSITKEFPCSSAGQPLTLGFSPEGALSTLVFNKTNWAAPDHLLGRFIYKTYNETDFSRFASVYNYHGSSAGFNKVNVTRYAAPKSRSWPVLMTAAYQKSDGSCDFWTHMKMVDQAPVKIYGAPRDIWVRYYTYNTDSAPGVNVTLTWFDKTTTRLPEALMFSFKPSVIPNYRYFLSKINQLVDPLNGILNGSHYLHALDQNGFFYIDPTSAIGLQLSSPDVALVSPFTADNGPASYAMPLSPPTTPLQGAAFNLYNNVWDTNYILWYPYLPEDTAQQLRFSLQFILPGSPQSSALRQKLAEMRG